MTKNVNVSVQSWSHSDIHTAQHDVISNISKEEEEENGTEMYQCLINKNLRKDTNKIRKKIWVMLVSKLNWWH